MEKLLERAKRVSGIEEKDDLLREALTAPIEREAARRVIDLAGTEPDLAAPPRLLCEPRVILVDTSIRIDCLRVGDPNMVMYLESETVLIQPWIIGDMMVTSPIEPGPWRRWANIQRPRSRTTPKCSS